VVLNRDDDFSSCLGEGNRWTGVLRGSPRPVAAVWKSRRRRTTRSSSRSPGPRRRRRPSTTRRFWSTRHPGLPAEQLAVGLLLRLDEVVGGRFRTTTWALSFKGREPPPTAASPSSPRHDLRHHPRERNLGPGRPDDGVDRQGCGVTPALTPDRRGDRPGPEYRSGGGVAGVLHRRRDPTAAGRRTATQCRVATRRVEMEPRAGSGGASSRIRLRPETDARGPVAGSGSAEEVRRLPVVDVLDRHGPAHPRRVIICPPPR
jgi:hypothetical protein